MISLNDQIRPLCIQKRNHLKQFLLGGILGSCPRLFHRRQGIANKCASMIACKLHVICYPLGPVGRDVYLAVGILWQRVPVAFKKLKPAIP